MHRDLFSAYLARYIDQDELSLHDAASQYQRAEPLLTEAWKRYGQTASGVGDAETPCPDCPVEQFSSKLGKSSQIAVPFMFRAKSCTQLKRLNPRRVDSRGVAQTGV